MILKKKWLLPGSVLLALLIIWELAVRALAIPLYVLPAPSKVALAFLSDFATLWGHAWITICEAAVGMLLALLLSLVLGIAMDAFPLVKASVYPILVVTQTVPMIVLAPIFIIYLGFGMAPKILTVVLMCFFPIAVGFTDGMAQLESGYVDLARSYGANRLQIYRIIKIPGSIPTLLSGLKVAATYSISGAVVGEWIAAQRGLGYYLLRVKNGYMLDKVFACVLMIVLLSLGMNAAVQFLRILLPPYRRPGKYTKKGL